MKLQKEFEEKIGYCFQDSSLLMQALTHSSYANEHHLGKRADNERLEFLGDAVLEIVSSEFLFHRYPEYPEGELTRMRASMVCEPTLAFCTRDLKLGKYLRLGKGEAQTGGRERKSILSDALEAVIGAIYLDGGFANAKEFIHRFVLNDMEHKELFYDSKTILQEIVQGNYTEELSYHLLGEEGPDHDKKFIVEAKIGDKVYGKGRGRTKKSAEQEAAYETLLQLKQSDTGESPIFRGRRTGHESGRQ
ncbi:MAG: ribonuclease III [Lachnospiraceae bacterium]|nr:ribonuclease III [Lachnospiraceae bacterium]